MAKLDVPRYMMATKAYHKLGDRSSSEPSLCVVVSEDEDNFYGNLVEGFGFRNVRFPKATTRSLTDAEKKMYNGQNIQTGNQVLTIVIK